MILEEKWAALLALDCAYGAEMAKAEFSCLLARLRRERGETQEVFGKRLGLNYQRIGRLERGEDNPSIGRIGGYLAALGLRSHLTV